MSRNRKLGFLVAVALLGLGGAIYLAAHYETQLQRKAYEVRTTAYLLHKWDLLFIQELCDSERDVIDMKGLVQKYAELRDSGRESPTFDILQRFSNGTDIWGNKIALERTYAGHKCYVVLHSDGPNGIHDGGRGDDIERSRFVSRVK